MTSKEALENIKTAPSFMGGNTRYLTCLQSSIPFLEDINAIKKDLDRLEKLEKENQELKEKCKTFEENEESILTTLKTSVQENDKLEKVIEILKDELDISFEDTSQEGNGYWVVLQNWSGEEEVVINFNTLDDYDLLKEVLGDD